MLGTKRTKQLQPRVTTAARYLAIKVGIDADEAEQEIWLGICERAGQQKTFLHQTDAYIVQAGVYHARNEWQKRHQRESRQVPEEEGIHVTSDNRLLDNICSGDYLERLMRRLRGDRLARETAKGLLTGFRKKEIAARNGVSPQAVSAAVRRVGMAIASIGGS